MRRRAESKRTGRSGTAIVAVLVLAIASVVVVQRVNAAPAVTFTSLHEPGIGGRVTAISVQPGGTAVLAAGDMLGVQRAAALGSPWQPATGLLSYEMGEFTWDPKNPDHVWVGSMSGAALSTDAGRTFTPARTGMPPLSGYPYSSPVQRVVFVGTDADGLLSFGGNQRMWAEDNWQPNNYGSVYFAARPANAAAAADWQWTLRATLPGNIVAASYYPPTTGLPAGRVWAVVRGGTGPGVYLSDDLGVTFIRLDAPGGGYDDLADLALHPTDPHVVWISRGAGSSLPGSVYRGQANTPPTDPGPPPTTTTTTTSSTTTSSTTTTTEPPTTTTSSTTTTEPPTTTTSSTTTSSTTTSSTTTTTEPPTTSTTAATGTPALRPSFVPRPAALPSATGTTLPRSSPAATPPGAADVPPTTTTVTWTALDGATLPLRADGNQDTKSGFETIEASATVPAGSQYPMLYTSDSGQFTKQTYASSDGGATWVKVLDSAMVQGLNVVYSGGGDMFTLAVDPANPLLVLAGSEEHLLSGVLTTSGCPNGAALCATWTDRATRRNNDGTATGLGFSGLVATRAVFNPFQAGQLSLNAMDGGVLLQTANGGAGWTRPLVNLSGRAFGDGWLDVWMGGLDTTYAKDTAGNVVTYVLKGQVGWFTGIAKSTNGGPFQLLEKPGGNGLPTGFAFGDATAIQALSTTEVVFTMDGCLWRSTNGGSTWTKQTKTCSLGLGDLVVAPNNPNRLIAQGRTAVYNSVNGGRTFTVIRPGATGMSPGASPGNGRLAAVKAGTTINLYATSTDGAAKGLFRWDGSTTGWTNLAAGLDTGFNQRILEVAAAPQDYRLLAAIVIDHPYHDKTFAPGVLLSRDAGKTWTVEKAGLGELRAKAVAWDPFAKGHLVVGTFGQGFFEATVG